MNSFPVAIWTHLRRTPGGLLAALTVCAFALLAIFAPLIAPYNPLTPTPAFRSPPSPDHWFGTDPTGLDVFSRVIYGTRLDLVVGVMGTLVSIAVGLLLGLIVGYYQNALTSIFLRVIDLLQAFPVFVLAMATVAIAGPSVTNVIAVIGILYAPIYVRLVRSRVLTFRELPVIEAARCVGNDNFRILVGYLLPNTIEPALVQASVNVGWAILLTASLSFIGAGIPVPSPEWGAMVSVGAPMIITGEWWAAFFPGLAIALTVLAFARLGDMVRELLNPERRV